MKLRSVQFKSFLKRLYPYAIIWLGTFILTLCIIHAWVPTSLGETKINRLHQGTAAIKGLLIDYGIFGPMDFLNDYRKYHLTNYFELQNYLAVPLLFFFTPHQALQIVHSAFSAGIVALVFYFARQLVADLHKPAKKYIPWLTVFFLITSFGFISYGGMSSVQDAPSLFWGLLSIWMLYKRHYSLFVFFMLLGGLSKIIIFATLPGICIYMCLKRRDIFIKPTVYLIAAISIGLYVYYTKWIITAFENFLYHSVTLQTTSNQSLQSIGNLQSLTNFNPVYLIRVFKLSPVLTILSLGSFLLMYKRRSTLPSFFLLIILSTISLAWIYFSSTTQGGHYLYFIFPMMALISIPIISRLPTKSIIPLIIISLAIFIYHQQHPEHKPLLFYEIPQIRSLVEPYHQNGELIQHGRDYTKYLYGVSWDRAYDYEWYGGHPPSVMNTIPPEKLENTTVIISTPIEIEKYRLWPGIDQFQEHVLPLKHLELRILTRKQTQPTRNSLQ